MGHLDLLTQHGPLCRPANLDLDQITDHNVHFFCQRPSHSIRPLLKSFIGVQKDMESSLLHLGNSKKTPKENLMHKPDGVWTLTHSLTQHFVFC